MKESNLSLNEIIKHLALVACRVGPAFEMSFSWSTNREAFKKKKFISPKSSFSRMHHFSIAHWHHLLYRVGFLTGKIWHPQEPVLARRTQHCVALDVMLR